MKRFVMRRPQKPLLVLSALFLCVVGLAGCEEENSANVRTSDIRPTFTATADGRGTTFVEATLRLTPASRVTYVRVAGGDELVATRIDPLVGSAVDQNMAEDDGLFGRYDYWATFAGDARDTLFEIGFDRRNTGEPSAYDSFVTLPTPFTLRWVDDLDALTLAPSPFSRSSSTPYFVVWDPYDAPDFEPGDVFRVEITGSCIDTYRRTIDWQGGEDVLELTGLLDDRDPPNDGQSCILRVEFTLSRAGNVDPAFAAGGSFVGEQVRVLNIRSTP